MKIYLLKNQKFYILSGLMISVFISLNSQTIYKDDNVIHEYSIHSENLREERDILISLPDDYKETDDQYPVLYVLDASKNYRVTLETVRYLDSYSFIPKLVVVGIRNTDRERDMTHSKSTMFTDAVTSGGGKTFQLFLKNELIPYIDKQYRTYPYRVIIGHSLAGLFVFNMFLSDPSLFHGTIAVSPSLWWNNEEDIARIDGFIKTHSSLNNYLFISFGDGEGGFVQPALRKLRSSFETAQIDNFKFRFMHFPGENHITTYVSDVNYALNDLFSVDWIMPPTEIIKGLQAIQAYFSNLEKKLGYKIRVPQSYLSGIGDYFVGKRDFDEAIKISEYNIALHPESAILYLKSGDTYRISGNKEKAVSYYKKALMLQPGLKKAKTELDKILMNPLN